MTSRQHDIVSVTTARSSPSSDGEAPASLAPTRREDGAAGSGAHPDAEAVGLVTPTVVRLERALHRSLPIDVERSRIPDYRRHHAPAAQRHAKGAASQLSVGIQRSPRVRHRDRPTVRGGRSPGQTEVARPSRPPLSVDAPLRRAHGPSRRTLPRCPPAVWVRSVSAILAHTRRATGEERVCASPTERFARSSPISVIHSYYAQPVDGSVDLSGGPFDRGTLEQSGPRGRRVSRRARRPARPDAANAVVTGGSPGGA